MIYEKDGRRYSIRVEVGENAHEVLARLATKENLKGATFSGIGAVKDVEVGYYNLVEKEYHFTKYDALFELVSMSGNISRVNGEPMVHIHASFSGEDNNVFGGHVKSMVSGLSIEIFLIAVETPLEREHDDFSGLKLLKLSHSL